MTTNIKDHLRRQLKFPTWFSLTGRTVFDRNESTRADHISLMLVAKLQSYSGGYPGGNVYLFAFIPDVLNNQLAWYLLSRDSRMGFA